MEPQFHFYLDSADLDELRQVLPHPLVYGVTTNPMSMRDAGLAATDRRALVERILELGVRTVHVQVDAVDSAGIARDAAEILALGAGRTVIPKIPATRAGLAVGAQLAVEGAPITLTAVFDPEQALFAALAGAEYVAPYLGRISDTGADGLETIAQMQSILERYASPTRLLVASVRSRAEFIALLDIGVGAVTVPVRLAVELLERPLTVEAERAFFADAKASP